MAVESTLSAVSNRQNQSSPLNKLGNRPKATPQPTSLPDDSSEPQISYISSNDGWKALQKIKNEVRTQTNEVISRSNEKAALLDSALSVTDRQLHSAKKLKRLHKEAAEPEMIAREQERFHKLQQISEEVELEIAASNIESRLEEYYSIRSGDEEETGFNLQPVEYRAVAGDVSSPAQISVTLDDLRQSHDYIQQQRSTLTQLRRDIRDVAKRALKNIDNLDGNIIGNIHEARYTAHEIASHISSRQLDLSAMHAGLQQGNAALQTLLEE